MAMNPRLLMPRASGARNTFLLNQYPAAAAYSLRRLSTAYTGPAVQVRRSNDNAEDTFTPEQIANGALAAWVGAGNNGFVTTWYDQTGNANNVLQNTSNKQPQIVNGGSLVLVNGKAAIDFNGSAHALASSATIQAHGPVLSVTKSDKATGFQTIFRGGSAAASLHRFDDSNFRTFGASGPDISTATTPTNHLLLFSEFRANGTSQFINQSAAGTSASTMNSNARTILIGDGQTPEYFDGAIQEVVIFALSYTASMRLGIAYNANNYYGIF